MASFLDILDRPATEIKAPEAFPVGPYHAMVDGPPEPGKSSKKQTDFLKFKFRILKALEGVDQAKALEQQVVGKIVTQDYYIVDSSVWRLKELLADHLGIDPANKSMREMLAEAPGQQLIVKIRHDISDDGKRTFHKIDSTAHV